MVESGTSSFRLMLYRWPTYQTLYCQALQASGFCCTADLHIKLCSVRYFKASGFCFTVELHIKLCSARYFKLQAFAVPLTYILNSVLSGTSKVQAYAVPLTCILNSALSGTLSFRLMLYRWPTFNCTVNSYIGMLHYITSYNGRTRPTTIYEMNNRKHMHIVFFYSVFSLYLQFSTVYKLSMFYT